MLQTSVEIVKPGGTGRPALVISASPEPLPPSRSFMCRFPSALPLPKKYTDFFGFEAAVRAAAAGDCFRARVARFFAASRFAITSCPLFRDDLGHVGDVEDDI